MPKHFSVLKNTLLLFALFALLGCALIPRSSEERKRAVENIQSLLQQANYCNQDVDCELISTHCAIGYQFLVNKTQVKKLKEITEKYVDEFHPEAMTCSSRDPNTPFSCVKHTCRFHDEI